MCEGLSRLGLSVQDHMMGAGGPEVLPPQPAINSVPANAPTSLPPQKRSHPYGRGDVYAALDLGTNNCRLLVAQPVFHGFRVIDAFSRIVRLGEGLSASGSLSDDAIERSISALKICAEKIEARGVTRARLIATEACRAASNGKFFIERVRNEVGLNLEIVDRNTEALLAASGCVALVDPDSESVILFDIGGGSTELIWLGKDTGSAKMKERVREWTSLPLGVVTLAEKYGGRDVTRDMFENMVRDVMNNIVPFAELAKHASQLSGFHLLGTSGTVTTLAGLHLNLPRYDRKKVDGLWMSEREIDDVIDNLLDLSFEQRAASPCIGQERADLVLAGCAILEGIRRSFPAERLRVADRGLREGILMNMMREDRVWWRKKR
jgi:exopolyphosphatase / guanosine-5'-triphosphate,3'-diphosphate pyrophosphatase